MAKLNREKAVRERRLRKQAKKNARRQAALEASGGESDAPPATPLTDTPD